MSVFALYLFPPVETDFKPQGLVDFLVNAGAICDLPAVLLTSNSSGAVEYDPDGIIRRLEWSMLRDRLEESHSIEFFFKRSISFKCRVLNKKVDRRLELSWSSDDYRDSLVGATRDFLFQLAVSVDADFALMMPRPHFYALSYLKVESGRIIFSPDREEDDILKRTEVWIRKRSSIELETSTYIGGGLSRDEDSKIFRVHTFERIAEHPSGTLSLEPSVLQTAREFESLLNELEATRELMERPQVETHVAPLPSSEHFAKTMEEAIIDAAGVDVAEAPVNNIPVEFIDEYAEQIHALKRNVGGAVNASVSLSISPDFSIWKRVDEPFDEHQRLESILTIMECLEPVVESLLAGMRIQYHNHEWDGMVCPEREIVGRVLDMPDHVAPVILDEWCIPFKEPVLSTDSLRKTLQAALRMPPPANANRAPYWTEIDFRCVRVSIYDPKVFGKYKVYVGGDVGVLEYPVEHTPSGFKLHAPDVETWSTPPVHMKAVRFRDIVGMHFFLHWSPWRTKGTPEYNELKKAVLALRAKGWKVDDSAHGLFDLPPLNQS